MLIAYCYCYDSHLENFVPPFNQHFSPKTVIEYTVYSGGDTVVLSAVCSGNTVLFLKRITRNRLKRTVLFSICCIIKIFEKVQVSMSACLARNVKYSRRGKNKCVLLLYRENLDKSHICVSVNNV